MYTVQMQLSFRFHMEKKGMCPPLPGFQDICSCLSFEKSSCCQVLVFWKACYFFSLLSLLLLFGRKSQKEASQNYALLFKKEMSKKMGLYYLVPIMVAKFAKRSRLLSFLLSLSSLSSLSFLLSLFPSLFLSLATWTVTGGRVCWIGVFVLLWW